MAELTISPEEIRDALDKFVSNFNPDTASRDEVGTVVTSGDGIARVEGLPSVMASRPPSAARLRSSCLLPSGSYTTARIPPGTSGRRSSYVIQLFHPLPSQVFFHPLPWSRSHSRSQVAVTSTLTE